MRHVQQADRDGEQAAAGLARDCRELEAVEAERIRGRWEIHGKKRGQVIITVDHVHLKSAVQGFRDAYARALSGGLLR